MRPTIPHLPDTPENAWANQCRAWRLSTVGIRWRNGKTQPMTAGDFTDWLNDLLKGTCKPIKEAIYRHWESGRTTPEETIQKAVKAAVNKNIKDVQ